MPRAGRCCCCSTRTASRWDPLLIRRGMVALARSEALGGARGPYALQAALAACHARAATAGATDWVQIVALYDALAQVAPSPVVELNRAVAVGMAFGPAAGLELVDALSMIRRSPATTCCRACAATCWPSSGGTPRPKPNSAGPPA
jgi:predicted RNA polymerase sigma factor